MLYTPANTRIIEIPDNITDVIWHYTDLDAVKNIIKSCSFHATCYYDFKDKNEIQLGLNLVMQTLESLQNTDDYISTIYTTIKQLFDKEQNKNLGILSFTDKSNSQYHWDNYGNNEKPHCSIGFNTGFLIDAFSNLSFKEINCYRASDKIWFNEQFPLAPIQKVVYDLPQNTDAINKEISQRISNILFNRNLLENDGIKEANMICERIIFDELISIILYTKSREYELDSEVRFALCSPTIKNKKYNDKIIRYINVQVDPTVFPHFISEVIIDSETEFEKFKREIEEVCMDSEANFNNLKISQRQI